MNEFDFLIPVLYDWLNDKWETAFGPIGIDIEEKEFVEKFINPYIGYSLEELKIITKEQTRLSAHYLGKIVLFDINVGEQTHYNALHWLMVNIAELNLNGLDFFYLSEEEYYDYCIENRDSPFYDYMDFVHGFTQEPYKQCHFCGQPDKDKTKKKFNKRRIFCHSYNCAEDEPNIKEHEEDCCFRQWKIIKKHYRQKLNRALSGKRLKSLQERKEKVIHIFLEFCEYRFKENLSIKYEIQAENKKSEIINQYFKNYN